VVVARVPFDQATRDDEEGMEVDPTMRVDEEGMEGEPSTIRGSSSTM